MGVCSETENKKKRMKKMNKKLKGSVDNQGKTLGGAMCCVKI